MSIEIDAGVWSDGVGWIDVTVPLRDRMVHWPGDPEARVERVKDMARGDAVTVSRLDVGAHTGTHVDGPAHFVHGAEGVDEIDLSRLMGPARVLCPPDCAVIDRATVDAFDINAGERIIFRTRNSERCWRSDAFVPDYTYLSLEAAQRLVEIGVRTIGIDYLSIGGGDDGPEIHRTLLGAAICVIEGLDLSRVDPGPYDLLCLPLRIQGGDGAPARVLLRPRR